ncbi:salicylaldehyde dehydrogenase [Dipodascopsis uninucleata]
MAISKHVVPLIINGKHVVSKKASTHIPVYSAARLSLSTSPLSELEPEHFAQSANLEQIIEAAKGSFRAFKQWKKFSHVDQRSILLDAAEKLKLLRNEAIDIQMIECSTSKEFASAMFDLAIRTIVEQASLITSSRGIIPRSEYSHMIPLIVKEPIGPVLGIAPWNAAPILAIRSFVTPLAAGCASIFKTSELAPATQFLMADAFCRAGLPDGLLNVLHMHPEDAPEYIRTLISRPEIRKINFTGSIEVGCQVAAEAGHYSKPLLLELGGKCSSIICDDADLAKAASTVLIGAWLNQGQICMSTERVFVQAAIYDQFTEELINAAVHLKDKITGFHQVTEKYAMKVNKMRRDAIDEGAKVLFGDIKVDCTSRALLSPTILSNVSVNSRLFSEESFGPTVLIHKVSSTEEAIDIINENIHGLSASIWTKDIMKGIRIAQEIESGAVHINGNTVHDQSTLPHGGVKSSGYGRFGSSWGLEEFMITKTITLSGL